MDGLHCILELEIVSIVIIIIIPAFIRPIAETSSQDEKAWAIVTTRLNADSKSSHSHDMASQVAEVSSRCFSSA